MSMPEQPGVKAHLVIAGLMAASSALRGFALCAALMRSWLRCCPVVPAVDADLRCWATSPSRTGHWHLHQLRASEACGRAGWHLSWRCVVTLPRHVVLLLLIPHAPSCWPPGPPGHHSVQDRGGHPKVLLDGCVGVLSCGSGPLHRMLLLEKPVSHGNVPLQLLRCGASRAPAHGRKAFCQAGEHPVAFGSTDTCAHPISKSAAPQCFSL